MLFLLVNNVVHSCWNNFLKTGMIYHVPAAMKKVVGSTGRNNLLRHAWTILLVQQPCSNMISILFRGCSVNNVVQSCDIFARVVQITKYVKLPWRPWVHLLLCFLVVQRVPGSKKIFFSVVNIKRGRKRDGRGMAFLKITLARYWRQ